jgi:hypothetical protein
MSKHLKKSDGVAMDSPVGKVKTSNTADRRDEIKPPAKDNSGQPQIETIENVAVVKGVSVLGEDVHQDTVGAQELGTSCPGIGGAKEFADTAKAIEEAEESSGTIFRNAQEALNKDLEAMPDVAAAQSPAKPDYNFSEDNVAKSISTKRLKIVWELNKLSKAITGERQLFKGMDDPIQKQYKIFGLEIGVEWPAGKPRMYGKNNSKTGKTGTADYGFFMNTTSSDNGAVDTYIGKHRLSKKVFIILQRPTPWDIEHGVTDPEPKYCLCFNSAKEAVKAYKSCMPAELFLSISEITLKDLKKIVEGAKEDMKKASDMEDCGYLNREQQHRFSRGKNAPLVQEEVLGLNKSLSKSNQPIRLVFKV